MTIVGAKQERSFNKPSSGYFFKVGSCVLIDIFKLYKERTDQNIPFGGKYAWKENFGGKIQI